MWLLTEALKCLKHWDYILLLHYLFIKELQRAEEKLEIMLMRPFK